MSRKDWLRNSVAAMKVRLMHSCHDMTRLTSLAHDEKLPRFTRWKMRLHCMACLWCRRYRDQLSLLRRALRHLPGAGDVGAAGVLSDEFRTRLKQAVRESTN